MDRLLYVSSVGLSNIEQAQTARANNLANASTNGFRADLARVSSQEVSGDGYRTRVYAVNEGAGVDLSSGTQVETSSPLDIAINGDGLFSVLAPDGTEGYTRNGSLQVDSAGRLSNSNGFQMLGTGGPVVLPPFESIQFGSDGAITIRPQGQGSEALVQIDQLKLVNPSAAEVFKDEAGLIRNNLQEPFPNAAGVSVNSGFIESSNVNAVHELTEIISLARQFELEVKMMKVAEGNDEAVTQLLRIG
ncbi:MAG: flagellar hook-basal body complex protein [Pseudomonadales bacterium]|nr:flagellar hook-basal body complex protein [Pseudomonadales bacterium]